MMIRLPRQLWIAVFTCSMLSLASCASRVALPVQPAQTSAVHGKVIFGVIAASRAVVASGSQYGLDGVLAAIQQPDAPAAGVTATEYIIQCRDDTAVSIVIRGPDDAPGSAAARRFSVGDKVQIVDGVQPELLHSD